MKLEQFIAALNELGIELDEIKLKQLEKYYELLITWNEKINLTTITEHDQVYLKHFYDSATLVKAVDFNKELTLCDVGTGAGFPGVVIKILYPNLKVYLVDSLNKRITFLNDIISQLDLKDIYTFHSRAEDFSKTHFEEFDVVTSRAVAPLNILIEYCVPLVKINKYFIPMKANIKEEIIEANNALKIMNCFVENTYSFKLPIEKSERNIIKIVKNKSTNKKYPRTPVEIKKQPL